MQSIVMLDRTKHKVHLNLNNCIADISRSPTTVNPRENNEQTSQCGQTVPNRRFCFAVTITNIYVLTEKQTYPIPREDCFCEGCTFGGGTGCGGICRTKFFINRIKLIAADTTRRTEQKQKCFLHLRMLRYLDYKRIMAVHISVLQDLRVWEGPGSSK